MGTNPNILDQLVLAFRQRYGNRVIHVPYTSEFETLCKNLNAQSIEDKHRVWESLVDVESDGGSNVSSRQDPELQSSSMVTESALAGVSSDTDVEERDQDNEFDTVDEPIPDTLFHSTPVPDEPWTFPAAPQISQERQEERTRLLAEVAESRLGSVELRVLNMLQKYPETRDSDIALCIKYWTTYQADVIEQWDPLELEVLFELEKYTTIDRFRRHLQNTLRLYRGKEDITSGRTAAQQEFYQYLAAEKHAAPEIRFYIDETGNEGGKAYTGIAGLCVINWKQYQKHYSALSLWREKQDWPGTLHFNETSGKQLDLSLKLLGQLKKRRAGLLFLGYAINSRGRTQEALFTLFVQLVVDSIRHLRESGCISEFSSVQLIKEADEGFDSVYLDKLSDHLAAMISMEFPGQYMVEPVVSLGKGNEVFLECADLIAGGMQRRFGYSGRNPKDQLAEAVFNVTGFDSRGDDGVVFKHYLV